MRQKSNECMKRRLSKRDCSVIVPDLPGAANYNQKG